MDWMQFVSSLVSSLAWPSVTVFILLTFKNQISKLIPLLQKLKIGALEADFSEELMEIKAETAGIVSASHRSLDSPSLTSTTSVGGGLTINRPSPVQTLADHIAIRSQPTGAVMEAWKMFELSLSNAYTAASGSPGNVTTEQILKYLAAVGFFTDSEQHAIMRLKALRNRAAHSRSDISIESAQDFVELVETLNALIQDRAQEHADRRASFTDALP